MTAWFIWMCVFVVGCLAWPEASGRTLQRRARIQDALDQAAVLARKAADTVLKEDALAG